MENKNGLEEREFVRKEFLSGWDDWDYDLCFIASRDCSQWIAYHFKQAGLLLDQKGIIILQRIDRGSNWSRVRDRCRDYYWNFSR